MRTNNMKLKTLETFVMKVAYGAASSILLLLLLGMVIGFGFAKSSFAQGIQPKKFASPAQAANALFEAAQKEDEQALEAILGAGRGVTSSGDEVEDKVEREQFSQKYQEMHRLVRERDQTIVLYIGAENWPFPIPLVSKNGAWYFDSDSGKREILFRTIGENEAAAIQVCEEFAMAKKDDSVKADSEDPITRFAEELVSAGAANTYNNDSKPFDGYYFRIVRNSVAGTTRKARGLRLIAYPAEYRESGVMTFVVTHHGIVHEKDLGPNTATVAPQIKSGTGASWHPVVSPGMNGLVDAIGLGQNAPQ
jgi:Protein of unknown function (DUF2950)